MSKTILINEYNTFLCKMYNMILMWIDLLLKYSFFRNVVTYIYRLSGSSPVMAEEPWIQRTKWLHINIKKPNTGRLEWWKIGNKIIWRVIDFFYLVEPLLPYCVEDSQRAYHIYLEFHLFPASFSLFLLKRYSDYISIILWMFGEWRRLTLGNFIICTIHLM